MTLRYRRADPQDMHYGYWSNLLWFAILLAMITAGIYMAWHWPWGSHGHQSAVSEPRPSASAAAPNITRMTGI